MSRLNLIATTSFGLEAVVARELLALGYADQKTEDGRIRFVGDEAAICRSNLWLRSSERLLVEIGTFEARDFGALFDQTTALPWSDWIPADGAFPVRGKSVRSQLHSVPDCQSIVKKAIVEQLKRAHRTQTLDETGAPFAVEVSILKDRVTLSLDTSGAGLHKRGYRTLTGAAPLKETLAAALVQLSYWKADRPFIDPFCGTGTIPIEAALIGRNIAPGINRSFAAETWPRVPTRLWQSAREECHDTVNRSVDLQVMGNDYNAQVLRHARQHANQANVDADIHFQKRRFADFTSARKYGCLVCNPPYGQRLGDQEESEELYSEMGPVLAQLDTWSIYVLTASPRFESLFGRRADRRRKLYNGRIQCTYYQFAGPRPPR